MGGGTEFASSLLRGRFNNIKQFIIQTVLPFSSRIARFLVYLTGNNDSDNNFYLLCYRLLHRVFPQGIIYHPGQIAVIKRTLLSETPLVFLPVFQSTLDPVVVQRLLGYQFGLATLFVRTWNHTQKLSTSIWSILFEAYRYHSTTM